MKTRSYFPPPESADEQGLLAIGGDFSEELLKDAYSNGIFPWPQRPSDPIFWFSPDPRGVLFFSQLHYPRSFLKWRKKIQHSGEFRITRNEAFADVMEACRLQKRLGQSGTWILPDMIPAYTALAKKGLARSIEIWNGTALVGGLYGVDVGHVFSAESMFHLRSNASKLALATIMEDLRAEGRSWMDLQMITSVSEAFGGRYIPREQFLKLLRQDHRQLSAK